MPKVIPIATDKHFADYEDWAAYAEYIAPQHPQPDYKAANRKNVRDYLVDGFWIMVAIFVVYFVSRVQS